jgi:putative hydrolase of the HAD superfamily
MAPLPTHLPPKGKLRKALGCLLCDIYGTLFISGSGDILTGQQHETPHGAIDELLARYKLHMSPTTLVHGLHTAIDKEHQKALAMGVDYPEIQIEKLWSLILPFKNTERIRAFAVEYEMIMNPVWPMPGVDELITTCQKNGLGLGIISNAQFFTPYLFEWFLGKDPQALGFDPRLTFYSYQYARAKPSAFLYQLAVKKLHQIGISTDRVAFIGNDMRNDIVPARQAGFQTILFAGDARSLRMRKDDPTCQNVDPDLRITHLNQLTPYLTKG